MMNGLKRFLAFLVVLMLAVSAAPELQPEDGLTVVFQAQAAGSPSKAPVTDNRTENEKKIAAVKVGGTVDITIKGVKYTLKKLNSQGELELISALSKGKRTISVPGKIGSFKITTIGRKAFKNCKKATTIELPTTITTIRACAFQGSKAKTLKINSAKLKKSSVKGALKHSKIKTIKVPRSKNKAYKKIFTKKIAGRKAKIITIK